MRSPIFEPVQITLLFLWAAIWLLYGVSHSESCWWGRRGSDLHGVPNAGKSPIDVLALFFRIQ